MLVILYIREVASMEGNFGRFEAAEGTIWIRWVHVRQGVGVTEIHGSFDVLRYTTGEGTRVQRTPVHIHRRGPSALGTRQHPVKLAAVERQPLARFAVRRSAQDVQAYWSAAYRIVRRWLH